MIGLQPIDVLESKNYTHIAIRRFYSINANALIYKRTIPVFVNFYTDRYILDGYGGDGVEFSRKTGGHG